MPTQSPYNISFTLVIRVNCSLIYLFQPLHVVRLHPVHGGFPSLSWEVVDKILQKVPEFLLGFLNVDVGPPDHQVGLGPGLTRHPRGGGVASLGKGERERERREGRSVG